MGSFFACSVGLILAGIVSFGFLIVAGIVNCYAEERFWSEFWRDTPTTEGAGDESAQVIYVLHPECLKRAA